MTRLNDRTVEYPPISGVEKQDAVEALTPHLKPNESTPPTSPQAAFEEFVEGHSELLQRLAL